MADIAALNAAAQRKRAAALERATVALNELADEGAVITFQDVARRGGVSRQWLYRQPELRAQIEQLRQRPSGAPVRQRTSEGLAPTTAADSTSSRLLMASNARLRRSPAVKPPRRCASDPKTKANRPPSGETAGS